MPVACEVDVSSDEECVVAMLDVLQACDGVVKEEEWISATARDDDLQRLIKFNNVGGPLEKVLSEEMRTYASVASEISCYEQICMRGYLFIPPAALRECIIATGHLGISSSCKNIK